MFEINIINEQIEKFTSKFICDLLEYLFGIETFYFILFMTN